MNHDKLIGGIEFAIHVVTDASAGTQVVNSAYDKRLSSIE